MALQPARVVTGRVTYADTGAAAGHAWLSLSSSGQGTGFSFFQADADGHFRVNTSSGDSLTLEVQADSGKPYLGTVQQLDWPKGAVKQTLDIKLVPGVVIEGRVVEDGSDKPVQGAILRFAPSSRQTSKPGHYDVPAFTQADGSFHLVMSPGPGSLVVQGPSDDYILKEFGINGGLITSTPR